MLSNKNIVEEYFASGRDKNRLLDFVSRALSKAPAAVAQGVKNWIGQFNRRWSKTHSKDRFFKKNAEWLESIFEVRIPGRA